MVTGMRIGKQDRRVVPPLWARWLQGTLKAHDLSSGDLGRAIARNKTNAKDACDDPVSVGAYARLVRDWLVQKKVVTANSAFLVGEILHDLDVPTCGYRAALGAGYPVDVARAVVALAEVCNHRLSALALYVARPIVTYSADYPQEFHDKAAMLLDRARASSGDDYRKAWEARHRRNIGKFAPFEWIEQEISDEDRDAMGDTVWLSLSLHEWAESNLHSDALGLFRGDVNPAHIEAGLDAVARSSVVPGDVAVLLNVLVARFDRPVRSLKGRKAPSLYGSSHSVGIEGEPPYHDGKHVESFEDSK
jgi:hypothetical protein